MSTLNDAKLTLIPSGYKSTKVYSVKPTNGDGDFTFARTGEATRVNQGGNIETVATNVPRIDHFGGGCPSLLLEDASTNQLTRSSDFDNWSKVNITVASDSLISPSGELDADTLTRNSTSASYLSKSFAKTSSSELDMTMSVFVKQNVGDYFAMRAQGFYPARADIIFQFSTKTFTTSVSGSNFSLDSTKYEDYGNGWYRLSAKFNTDSFTTMACFFSPRSSSGQVDSTDSASDSSVYLWGAQCEYDDLSSFIPTTTAAVTRNAETCSGSGNSNVFNDTEGVLYFEAARLNSEDNSSIIFSVSDGSNSNAVSMYYYSAGIGVDIFNSLGTKTILHSISLNQQAQFNKLAIKYKSGDMALYFNGNEVATNTDAINLTGLNELKASYGNGQFPFYGKVKDLRYYDSALTDQQLAELTT